MALYWAQIIKLLSWLYKIFFHVCDKGLAFSLIYYILAFSNFLETIYAFSKGPTNIAGPKCVDTTQTR